MAFVLHEANLNIVGYGPFYDCLNELLIRKTVITIKRRCLYYPVLALKTLVKTPSVETNIGQSHIYTANGKKH